MEDWLKKKKLNEAYNIMQMRDHKKQEEIENEAKNQLQNQRGGGVKTFKQWMIQQEMMDRVMENDRARMAQMQADQ